jgi:hypothetical protein
MKGDAPFKATEDLVFGSGVTHSHMFTVLNALAVQYVNFGKHTISVSINSRDAEKV